MTAFYVWHYRTIASIMVEELRFNEDRFTVSCMGEIDERYD